MAHAPVDVLVTHFRDPDFHGRLAASLADLVNRGLIRVIDLVFVSRDPEGAVVTVEVADLGDRGEAYRNVEGEYDGLLSDDDVAAVAADLDPGTAAGLLVWENLWAADFAAALHSAGGTVVLLDRIPADAVDRAFAGIE